MLGAGIARMMKDEQGEEQFSLMKPDFMDDMDQFRCLGCACRISLPPLFSAEKERSASIHHQTSR